MLQRLAIEKFHGDEGLAVLCAGLVNRADVGVVQRGRRLSFAAEAFERLWVARDIVGKKFQRYEAVQVAVFRFVDHTHTAATEFFDDSVV